MSEPAIRVDNVSFSYGDIKAVKGVSFEVAPGEILGFLGPNGAGTSTTIKILTGQLTPEAGNARVLGVDVRADDPVMQAQIGVCFEEKNLYDTMSANENLRFFASLFGIKDVNTDDLLRRVGLADRANDRVSKYSKGMRQRLMMARALVNQPQILLLDEPTDGLDPVSAIAIRDLVREEAARGAAVLLTTHDMHEADSLSNRVAFINQGALLTVDTPENLKLAHGRRSIRIRMRRDGEIVEQVVAIDEPAAADEVKRALGSDDLLTVHTEEATLEDIFVEYAGRGLAG